MDSGSVERWHAAAIDNGGTDNGAPGLRAEYSGRYYAAFALDPDGNNVEAVFHVPCRGRRDPPVGSHREGHSRTLAQASERLTPRRDACCRSAGSIWRNARFLETERLALRRFTENDTDLLIELDSDPEVMYFITGGRPTPRSRTSSRSSVVSIHRGIGKPGQAWS